MQSRKSLLVVSLGVVCWLGRPVDADDERLFEVKIRPVLVDVCFRCHGGEKISGGLRIDSRAAVLQGGDSGAAIVVNDPEASLLIKALRRNSDASAMPPDKPLDPTTIEAFADWIRAGAPWPDKVAEFRRERHWAFEPLSRVVPPADHTGQLPTGARAIDALLDVELQERAIVPLGPADKRTLIRRATYDLTGLPPSPIAVAEFLADESPNAFARVIDRLLESRQYGEQWGRHWLDIVRYADTAGENSDHPLPHAWRYRNWVLEAFSQDKPYDQFLREQLAGDILAAALSDEQTDSRRYQDLIVATGYLAIARRFGHDIDKDMHLTHEDVIDTLGKSVLGLTLGCARCHSHKYDPITADDYYGLYGIFASTRFSFPGCEFAQRTRDLVPLVSKTEHARLAREFQEPLQALDARLKVLDDMHLAGARELQEQASAATRLLAEGVVPDSGQQTIGSTIAPLEKLAVRAGEMVLLAISPQANHGADSTRIELEITEVGGSDRVWSLSRDVLEDLPSGNPHTDKQGNPGVWCFLDLRPGLGLLPEMVRDLSGKSGLNVWRQGDTPSVFVNATEQPIEVWTKLPPRTFFAHPAPDGNVGIGWLSPIRGEVLIRGLVADAHPGGDGVGWKLTHSAAPFATPLSADGDRLRQIADLRRQRTELAGRLPPVEVAYAVEEGTSQNARLHERGDPEKLGREVPRRWLEMFGGQLLPPGSGSGRLELANWLTGSNPVNPLTARVMVNRIWQYHFGTGIVKTPNDFGTRGQPPTHPELLDWLAAEFIRSGWSVKQMHRTIMLSSAYQRTSQPAVGDAGSVRIEQSAQAIDPENHFYWRFNCRRLSAEEIRDSLLLASGQLDPSPGGPHPFPAESAWNFTQHNPFNAVYETDRRSVYLMVLRNRRHPFLGLFDGADPNASTPQRQSTTVPTQALFFMNDPFFHGQAAKLAARLPDSDDESIRLNFLFPRVFQRPPSTTDLSWARSFLDQYDRELTDVAPRDRRLESWTALIRVLLASNEFIYVD